jgi:hypothetical protein
MLICSEFRCIWEPGSGGRVLVHGRPGHGAGPLPARSCSSWFRCTRRRAYGLIWSDLICFSHLNMSCSRRLALLSFDLIWFASSILSCLLFSCIGSASGGRRRAWSAPSMAAARVGTCSAVDERMLHTARSRCWFDKFWVWDPCGGSWIRWMASMICTSGGGEILDLSANVVFQSGRDKFWFYFLSILFSSSMCFPSYLLSIFYHA